LQEERVLAMEGRGSRGRLIQTPAWEKKDRTWISPVDILKRSWEKKGDGVSHMTSETQNQTAGGWALKGANTDHKNFVGISRGNERVRRRGGEGRWGKPRGERKNEVREGKAAPVSDVRQHKRTIGCWPWEKVLRFKKTYARDRTVLTRLKKA